MFSPKVCYVKHIVNALLSEGTLNHVLSRDEEKYLGSAKESLTKSQNYYNRAYIVLCKQVQMKTVMKS